MIQSFLSVLQNYELVNKGLEICILRDDVIKTVNKKEILPYNLCNYLTFDELLIIINHL